MVRDLLDLNGRVAETTLPLGLRPRDSITASRKLSDPVEWHNGRNRYTPV